MSQDRQWTDPVSLGSVTRDYDQGFADGCSESKRLNEHLVAAFAQGRAAGLEECGWGVFWTENGIPCSVLCGSEADALGFAARNLIEGSGSVEPVYRKSPTPSDAGKDDARDAARWRAMRATTTALRNSDGERLECTPEELDAAADMYIAQQADTIDAAMSSLEVIGKGEKK